MAPIRLGVIGLGLIWIRVHKPILAALRDTFEPVAFCDVSEQRRAETAQEFPAATVLSDYQSLLALPEVDAVLVLTPLALNQPMALAALLAGKHVIMEKPIARSLADGHELIATAQRMGRRLVITEQMGYRYAEDVVSEIIAAGEIGELVVWDRVQHMEADTAKGELRYENTPWRKQADFPLGTMFDGGIHVIAGLSKVFGAPEAVVATGRQLRPEYGEYDHVAAMFQYAHGVTGMLSFSSYLSSAQNHFHVYGSAGAIVAEHRQIIVEKPEPRTIELQPENSYASMWQAIAKSFREGSELFYTPEKALQDVAILIAIDQAIKTGARVPVTAIEG